MTPISLDNPCKTDEVSDEEWTASLMRYLEERRPDLVEAYATAKMLGLPVFLVDRGDVSSTNFFLLDPKAA